MGGKRYPAGDQPHDQHHFCGGRACVHGDFALQGGIVLRVTQLANNLTTSAITLAGEHLRRGCVPCRGGCAGRPAGEQLHDQRHHGGGRARAVPRGRTAMAGAGGDDCQRASGESL